MKVIEKRLMAFSYFGGKNSHLNFLLPVLNAARATHFVDVFGGSAAVALNMDAEIITYNDLNEDVVNFFAVLRSDPDRLIYALQLTPYSQTEYRRAWKPAESDNVERARCFYVRAMQSFGSCGTQKEYNSWSYSINSVRKSMSSHVAKYLKGIDGLYEVVSKLKTIQIENRDFKTIIDRFSSPSTLFYCDPPYPVESRTGNIRYDLEFSEADHIALAESCRKTDAYVAVSGYECELMNDLYGGGISILQRTS